MAENHSTVHLADEAATIEADLRWRNLHTALLLWRDPPRVVTSEWATARIAELEAELRADRELRIEENTAYHEQLDQAQTRIEALESRLRFLAAWLPRLRWAHLPRCKGDGACYCGADQMNASIDQAVAEITALLQERP